MARGKYQKRNNAQQIVELEKLRASIKLEQERCQALEVQLPELNSLRERISDLARLVTETWGPQVSQQNRLCMSLWGEIQDLDKENDRSSEELEVVRTGSKHPPIEETFEVVAREKNEKPLIPVETPVGVLFVPRGTTKARLIAEVVKRQRAHQKVTTTDPNKKAKRRRKAEKEKNQ